MNSSIKSKSARFNAEVFCLKPIWIATLIGTVFLSGCATDASRYMEETKSVDVTGAFQITDREAVEKINLANLLCQYAPNGNPSACVAESTTISTTRAASQVPTDEIGNQPASSEAASQQQVDQALHYFNARIAGISATARKATRNALQERLLTASTQRCNAYKGNLQRTFSRTNFNLGALSTIAGTVGALVAAPGAASNWAGVAAISSGSRAEFNQDFMSNLAAYVIVDGIDKRREVVYARIQEQGQSKPYEYYPVEAAIKDALYFHGQCSVIAGFQQASESIKTTNEPGLNAAIKAMAKVAAANEMLKGDKSSDVILDKAQKITDSPVTTGGSVGSNLDKDSDFSNLEDNLIDSINQIAETNSMLNGAISELREKIEQGHDASFKSDLKSIWSAASYAETIDADTVNNSIGKIVEYSRLEMQADAEARIEKNEVKSAISRDKAELQRSLKRQITRAFQHIAFDFHIKAEAKIHEWNVTWDKVRGKDNKDMKTFATSISTSKISLDQESKVALKALVTPKEAPAASTLEKSDKTKKGGT